MEEEMSTSETERLAKTVGGLDWKDYVTLAFAAGVLMFCAAVLWWALS